MFRFGRVFGIIPARAGFTRPKRTCAPGPGDHPRSRGVYYCGGGEVTEAKGSSPLARGLPGGTPRSPPRSGIIPARAGFTAGGELNDPRGSGSSPLARGLPRRSAPRRSATRIIPARAGFTPALTCSAQRTRDHPRSRGVYQETKWQTSPEMGSSPLARGLLIHTDRQAAAGGIIPARAGFTGTAPAS